MARWPELEVSPEAFAAHLARHLPASALLPDALATLRAEELYLALACGQGSAAAIGAFEAEHFPELPSLVLRIRGGAGSVDLDELRQQLRERLFVGPSPKILEYTGAGELKNWFRVAVVRLALNLVTRGAPASEGEDEELLLALPSSDEDPELVQIRRLYQPQFEDAFREGVRALPVAERTLLKQWFVDGASIDVLALVLGVHRATVARRLSAARRLLMEEVRGALVRRLKVTDGELDSLMRLLRSQLQLTPGSFLSVR